MRQVVGRKYFRMSGGHPSNAHGGFVMVSTYADGRDAVWGLSLWSPSGESWCVHHAPKTWAYRTLGVPVDLMRGQYPDAVWHPDRDRVPEAAT